MFPNRDRGPNVDWDSQTACEKTACKNLDVDAIGLTDARGPSRSAQTGRIRTNCAKIQGKLNTFVDRWIFGKWPLDSLCTQHRCLWYQTRKSTGSGSPRAAYFPLQRPDLAVLFHVCLVGLNFPNSARTAVPWLLFLCISRVAGCPLGWGWKTILWSRCIYAFKMVITYCSFYSWMVTVYWSALSVMSVVGGICFVRFSHSFFSRSELVGFLFLELTFLPSTRIQQRHSKYD